MTAGNGAEEVFTVLDGLARLAAYGETGMDRAAMAEGGKAN